jgi:hypothetical protein
VGWLAGRNWLKSHGGTRPVKLFMRIARCIRPAMLPMLAGIVPVISLLRPGAPSASSMYRYVSALIPEIESGMVPFKPKPIFRPVMCDDAHTTPE